MYMVLLYFCTVTCRKINSINEWVFNFINSVSCGQFGCLSSAPEGLATPLPDHSARRASHATVWPHTIFQVPLCTTHNKQRVKNLLAYFYIILSVCLTSKCRSQWARVCLRPFACWGCGFEFRRGGKGVCLLCVVG